MAITASMTPLQMAQEIAREQVAKRKQGENPVLGGTSARIPTYLSGPRPVSFVPTYKPAGENEEPSPTARMEAEDNNEALINEKDRIYAAGAQAMTPTIPGITDKKETPEEGATAPTEPSEEEKWWNGMFQQRQADIDAANEEQARKDRLQASRQAIANTADAISSIANLWGTTKGAVSQNQTYATPGVYESYIRDKAMRDANIAKLQSGLDQAYKNMLAARSKTDTARLAEERFRLQQEREKRLQRQFEATSEWRNNRMQIDWARLDQRERQFDENWDRRSEQEKERILLARARLAAQAQARSDADARRADKEAKEADKQAKKEKQTKIKNLATDWNTTMASIFKKEFGSSKPDVSKLTEEQKAFYERYRRANTENLKQMLVEEYANAHSDWASANGVGGSSAPKPSAAPQPAPKDDNSDIDDILNGTSPKKDNGNKDIDDLLGL